MLVASRPSLSGLFRAALAWRFHHSGEEVDWMRNEGNPETGEKLSLSEAGKMDERGRRCESGSERLPCKISRRQPGGGATSPLIARHRGGDSLKNRSVICSRGEFGSCRQPRPLHSPPHFIYLFIYVLFFQTNFLFFTLREGCIFPPGP